MDKGDDVGGIFANSAKERDGGWGIGGLQHHVGGAEGLFELLFGLAYLAAQVIIIADEVIAALGNHGGRHHDREKNRNDADAHDHF